MPIRNYIDTRLDTERREETRLVPFNSEPAIEPLRSEDTLWSAFKQGDEDAFVQIYEEYFVSLFRYGSQFTRSRDIIQNAIQDLFIELRKKRNKLSIANIRPYLFVSFRRKLIDYLRKHKENVVYDSDLLDGYNFHLELSPEQKIIDSQQELDNQSILSEAIGTLPVRQKEAVYLYFFENQTYEEVKQSMSLNDVKSVRNLIYKAVKKLKSDLLSLVIVSLFYF
ncbi:MAG: RNA polymerase subunit sigma [Phycisphaeraceae bacterium]|nr:RNA polymerase subunit sigma [Phycisphaeraceae bacterium]